MKRAFLISIVSILSAASLRAQDCQDCGQRQVFVNNLAITAPIPTANHDSIMNYLNAMKVTSAIRQYLNQQEMTSGCLNVSGGDMSDALDTTSILANPSILQYLANSGSGSDSGGDYTISGEVQAGGGGFTVHVRLEAGAKKELIAWGLGSLAGYPGGNPESTAADVAGQMTPVYWKIRDFEVNKRNQGAPYAIEPEFTGKPSKFELDFNEVTSVHIELKDCDGEPLPNRTITFTVEGGKLDQESVTTDDNGTADILFTAGEEAGIGLITPTFTYTTPTEKPGPVTPEPIPLQVKKPTDAWFFQGNWTMNETRESKMVLGPSHTQNSRSSGSEHVFICGWVKEKILPWPIPNTFVKDEFPAKALKYKGTSNSTGSSNELFINEAGYIKREGNFYLDAGLDQGLDPKIRISVSSDHFSFSFDDMNASQSGNYHDHEEIYIIYEGTKTEESDTRADPDVELNWSVNSASRDTSWSNVSHPDDNNTITNSVTQTCKWKDKVFVLNHGDTYRSETDYNSGGVEEHTYWNMVSQIKVKLWYNPPPAGIEDPGAYGTSSVFLGQNYPNPFDFYTRIPFEVRKPGPVSLTVLTLDGREVRSLLADELTPGEYVVSLDGSGLSGGVYYYRLKTTSGLITRKLLVLK